MGTEALLASRITRLETGTEPPSAAHMPPHGCTDRRGQRDLLYAGMHAGPEVEVLYRTSVATSRGDRVAADSFDHVVVR
jgi:hypothetical protein